MVILICEIQVSCQWLFIPVLSDDGWQGRLTVLNSFSMAQNLKEVLH